MGKFTTTGERKGEREVKGGGGEMEREMERGGEGETYRETDGGGGGGER